MDYVCLTNLSGVGCGPEEAKTSMTTVVLSSLATKGVGGWWVKTFCSMIYTITENCIVLMHNRVKAKKHGLEKTYYRI